MSTDSLPWLPEPPRRTLGEHGLEAYVSTPTGPRPGPGWPALIFLHGNGECADRRSLFEAFIDTPTAHGPLRRVSVDVERRVRGRFVIAAPQLPGAGGDIWQDYASDVGAVVEELIDRESVNPDRISLCGFSYGANGVVRLAGIHRWHGLWMVDPPMPPPDSLPEVRWYRLAFGQFTVGREARWLERMRSDRRVTDNYGLDHVQASRLDFGTPGNYDALT